jgi:uncharacterized membrane protein YdbT with pleckstrin-like domain
MLLEKHLSGQEKIIRFFRPARRAYLLQYLIYLFLAVAGISLITYMALLRKKTYATSAITVSSMSVVDLICYVLLLFSLFMLIRLELRIWSRRYALTNERMVYSRGIFSETFRSIQYLYITDISFQQSFWDKIMNTGTITVDTASTDEEITYRRIADPLTIKKIINEEQSRHMHTHHQKMQGTT